MLVTFGFLGHAILVGMKEFLTVVLIRISLMTTNVEPLVMSPLTLCISSLEKCLLKAFEISFLGSFNFAQICSS